MKTITLEELRDELDSIILVETLSPGMYAMGHLPGAINLPPSQIRELAPELLPDQGAAIVTYCGGGG